jgi:chemosensory pili system protein ChpE
VTPTSLVLLFLLGLGLSAAPGALNVETLRRGVRHGFSSALTVQLGALLGDALWVGVAVATVRLGLQAPLAGPGCMLLAGAALLWTAWHILRPSGAVPARPSHRRGLAVGALLALASPLTVVFWAAVGTMVRDDLGRAATGTELAVVAGVYVLSVLLWAVGLSGAAAWGGHLVTAGPTRMVNLGCAVLLAVWGVQLLGRATGLA